MQVVSRLTSRPLPDSPDLEIAGGNSIILAELTNGIVADIQMTLMASLSKWDLIINGESGTLSVTHEAVLQQNLNEDEAKALETSESPCPLVVYPSVDR